MQKLITVTIDVKQLAKSSTNPFAINEVDSINELLLLGWEIEEWDFLKEDNGDDTIILLVTLNDDAMFGDEDDEFEDDYNFGQEDDEEEDDSQEFDFEKDKN